MAEIINLRIARKRKANAVKADKAADNRVKFGRTKSEKKLGQATASLDDRVLDGHKRTVPPKPDQST